ncbi:MAG: hypothetical protein JNL70_10695 [Saprospiraceae bacterium]|nr:hypothetical protein [Saprospiraceae bacterium]
MNKETVQKYIRQFPKLRQSHTAYGKAPHKPVLSLSVMHQIEKGNILDNRIYLTPDWVAAFIEIFQRLVATGNSSEFTLLFYHLTGEGFWHLEVKSDKILRGYVKSINVLSELIRKEYCPKVENFLWHLGERFER